jgi:hypothetical protein
MIRVSSPGIIRINFLWIWRIMNWLVLNSKPKVFMIYRNNWVQIMMKMMSQGDEDDSYLKQYAEVKFFKKLVLLS